MLKELTKRLPFMQSSGKHSKSREKIEPAFEQPRADEMLEPAADEMDSLWDDWTSPSDEPPAAEEPAKEPIAEEPAGPAEDAASTAEQDLKTGLAACREKNYPAALEAFLRAAEQDCVEAQFLCGQMYQRGLAVDANDRQALNWYKRAAKLGFVHAQMACAALYEEGRGTEIDLKRALCWYEKAAKQGSVEAQLKCGVMYSCGRAETRNPKKARRWLEAAAESGNEEAMRILRERF